MAQEYIWNLTDLKKVPKNGYKVFSCFSCGGGSSMGYKLAGYEVLGNCEIDPKINAMYVKNHHPKYNFLMGVQDFYKPENIPNIPDELYHLDVLDGSPPCFGKGTPVKTLDGYKPIESVQVGDMVLTHKGRYRKVNAVMSKYADNVCEIKIQGCLPIITTMNHPFYSREMVRGGHIYKRKFEDPQWKNAGDLSISRIKSGTVRSQDYIGCPINRESEIPVWDGVSIKHVIYGRKTEWDSRNSLDMQSAAFWKFVGRYLGDGWRRKDRKTVLICDSKDKEGELQSLIEDAGLHGMATEQRTSVRFEISHAELWEFMGQLGDGARNKCIPEFVLNLPLELLTAFIDGYMGSDGSYDAHRDKYTASSVSLPLILGLQAAIAKVYGQPTTLTTKDNSGCIIEGRDIECQKAYNVSFFKEKRKQQHYIAEDGYLWLPFRDRKEAEPQEVFNLSVEEDESYTVYNIAVHNCSTFSTAGLREKAWGKEKKFREGQAKQVLDDLFFEFANVVELLKPKVVVAENVKGLVSGNAKGYVNLIIKRFNEIGYDCQLFLLNAATMGVPQKRERAFFICRRKDLGMPKIKLEFHEKPITYGEFADEEYVPMNKDTMNYARWCRRKNGDKSIGDTVLRTEHGKISQFNASYIFKNQVPNTLTAGGGMVRFDKPGHPSSRDLKIIQTFPQDYDFCGNDVAYVCGMSVPPFMMRGVAKAVAEQLLPNAKEA